MRNLNNDFTLEEYVDVRLEQIEWMRNTLRDLTKQAAYLFDDIEGFAYSVSDAFADYVYTDDANYYDAVDIDTNMDEDLSEDAFNVSDQYDHEKEKMKEFYNHANKLYDEIDALISMF